jgi:thermitase
VDVAAPGVAIFSTMPDHRVKMNGLLYGYKLNYDSLSGTSMAAPHVAGLAALVVASGKCVSAPTAACVRARIENYADKIGGTGNYWSKGRINAYRAVAQ